MLMYVPENEDILWGKFSYRSIRNKTPDSTGVLCKDGEQGISERGRRLQTSYHMLC